MARRRFAPFLVALVVALGLMPITPASAARNRPPKIKKAVMKDTDGDGMANKVILTYNERINHKLDTSRFPFRVQGYRIMKVNAARRSTKLVIVVKESASAPAKPDFIRYTRTRKQPVKDLKKLQAAKQLFTRNIIGLVVTEPPPVEPLLRVNKTGPGTVTSSPAGIACGSTCEANFAEGTSVTLSAAPDEGAAPEVAWTGCASNPTPTTCTVTMDAAKTVEATFTAAGQKTLSVSKEGNGTVTSTSTPTQATQINCGATCATTSASYPDATMVHLVATPGQQGMVVTWGGDCSGTGTTCDLVMDAAKSVTVKFELPTLTVTRDGTGTGSVTSSPAGITCGSTCTGEFAKDAVVTLTAAADPGSVFAGWSGGGCTGTQDTCDVAMDSTKTVTATFDEETTGPVMHQLTATSGAGGSVSCLADDGGTSCNGLYEEGTVVTITATFTPGSLNIVPSWTGCDTPVANVCTVTMNAPKVVSVTWGSL